jgi:hypothetical protein
MTRFPCYSVNKYLVIIAHSCPRCTNPRRDRSAALRPLLANKDLQIWTHIVMDAATARALAE